MLEAFRRLHLIINGTCRGPIRYEDDDVSRSSHRAPMTHGHHAVVPRAEIDNWQDRSAAFSRLMAVSHNIGTAGLQGVRRGAAPG